MNNTSVSITAINSITFDAGASSQTLNTAYISKHYVYTGTGTGGSLLTL